MILFVRFFCFIMCLPLRYLTTSRSTFNTVLTLTVLIIHYYFILHHVVEGMIPSFWFWFFFSSHPDALNFCFPLSPPVFSFLIACLLLSSIFYSSLLFYLFLFSSWCSDGSMLTTGSRDGACKVWSIAQCSSSSSSSGSNLDLSQSKIKKESFLF